MSLELTLLIVAWGVILLQTLALAGIVRQVRWIATRLPSERRLSVTQARGSQKLIHSDGRAVLILFLSRDCRACARLLPHLLSDARPHANRVDLRAVFAEEQATSLPPGVAVLEHRPDLFEAAAVRVTPYAIVQDPSGQIVRASAVGSRSELLHLMQFAAAMISEPDRIGIDGNGGDIYGFNQYRHNDDATSQQLAPRGKEAP